LALLVISPLIFLNLDLLLAPTALEQFLSRAIFDLKQLVPPIAFSLAGYVLGSFVRVVIKRSPRTA
jgi:hypothetical protein